MWKERLQQYDAIVGECPRFDRKGKTMPYTSANGHMFSQLNKDAELGIRFSEEVKERYISELGTGPFKSYGATMRGYVRIPDEMFEQPERIAEMLNESYDYVMTLEPK